MRIILFRRERRKRSRRRVGWVVRGVERNYQRCAPGVREERKGEKPGERERERERDVGSPMGNGWNSEGKIESNESAVSDKRNVGCSPLIDLLSVTR